VTNGNPVPWSAQLSVSLASLSSQLLSASRVLAQRDASNNQNIPEWATILSARLDALEAGQNSLRVEIAALRGQGATADGVPAAQASIPPVSEPSQSMENILQQLTDLTTNLKLECVQSYVRKKRSMLTAPVLCRQDRLYARLHNSRAATSKSTILAPPTANGKPPPGFPATKGEFEHLTRMHPLFVRYYTILPNLTCKGERYEALLKAYGQPLRGDTAAKKEATRVFLGLPAA
jgi:hypothetical protein